MKRVLFVALLFFVGSTQASLGSIVKCSDGICISVSKHVAHPFRDYLYYVNQTRGRHLIIRYEDGSVISMALMPGASPCKEDGVRVLHQSDRLVEGAGCLGDSSTLESWAIRFFVRSPVVDSEQFMLRVGPAIWLSGDGKGGSSVTSDVIPLGGF